MSGPRHEDFEARIKRIEERRGTGGETPTKATSENARTKPERNATLQNGNSRAIALIVLVLAFVGGGFVFMQIGSSSGTDQQTEVSGASILTAAQGWLSKGIRETETLNSNEAPAAVRTLTEQGWVIDGPGVANADRTELSLADVAQTVITAPEASADLELSAFDVNATCEVRKPKKDEVVHNIRLEHGIAETDLHVLSDAEITEALIKHITGVTSRDKAHLVGSMAKRPMAAVDVFVTDTAGPLYLVLQGFNADTIWNLQLADGVKLAHVVMIGENSGLAGMPEGTTFEALRISDFVTNFEFGSNDEFTPCMIAPWRTPEPHWPAFQKAQNGNMLFENQMHSYEAGARAFAAWYSEALGRDTSKNLVSAKAAVHVLAGPVPAIPVTLSPLSGRSVHVTQNDRFIRGDDVLKQSHDDLLAAAIGGDIALLDPEPMEVAQP